MTGVGAVAERTLVLDEVVIGWVSPSAGWGRRVALGAVDARKVAALDTARRAAFLTGRVLVGSLLEKLFPGSDAWTLDTEAIPPGGDQGPVAVRGVPALASVAYADGLVVAAVAPASRVPRLGVDVERDDPVRSAELAGLLRVGADTAPRRWTEVQAVLKAGRHGLHADPGRVHLGAGTGRVEGSSITFQARAVPGPPGYVVSVAWQRTGRP